MWRLIFKRLLGARVVTTIDHDGEIRWRFAYRNGDKFYARGIMGWIELKSDGTCAGKIYIEEWFQQ